MTRFLIVLVTGGLFLHHVICTVLYNAPDNPVTEQYQFYVSNYMEPAFTQKWLLFAPEPATSDLKLWYRYKSGANWSGWKDPIAPVIKAHHHRRYTYHAKLLYVYGNIARDLGMMDEELNFRFRCDSANADCRKNRNEQLLASAEFERAVEYVRRDIGADPNKTPADSLQLMIIRLYPKQFSERKSRKPFGFANGIEFNPVPFHP